jgi:hypothetical protein
MALQRGLARSVRLQDPESEAHSGDGLDHPRAGAIAAELSTEPIHGDSHRLTPRGIVVAPNEARGLPV